MEESFTNHKHTIFVMLVEYAYENKLHREELIAILAAFISREADKVAVRFRKKKP